MVKLAPRAPPPPARKNLRLVGPQSLISPPQSIISEVIAAAPSPTQQTGLTAVFDGVYNTAGNNASNQAALLALILANGGGGEPILENALRSVTYDGTELLLTAIDGKQFYLGPFRTP